MPTFQRLADQARTIRHRGEVRNYCLVNDISFALGSAAESTFEHGHVLLFSNNPFWRAETQGSYFLVFNAILNFDNLNAGRKLAEK